MSEITDSQLIEAIDLFSENWKRCSVHPKKMNVERYQVWLRHVLHLRLIEKKSLAETGKLKSITPERVRQIEFRFRRYATFTLRHKLFSYKEGRIGLI